MHSGVHQGSVIGLILISVCIKCLSTIIGSHYVMHYSFVDDLQLYMSRPDKISKLLR